MRINEDFIKEKLDDECILVPVGEGYRNGVFTLNETAEMIFDLLGAGKDKDEITAVLCGAYDTDQRTAAAYVDAYIAQLRENGILLDD